MSISTFYCNEQILLDNWQFYGESNTLLRTTLEKTSLTPRQCARFYLSNMNHPENMTITIRSLTYQFAHNDNKEVLRTISSVTIYQQDIIYVQEAIQNHHLTLHQAIVLFGFIFFTRMFETPILEMNTRKEIRRFAGCFEERIPLKSSYDGVWVKFTPEVLLIKDLVSAGVLKDASYLDYRKVKTQYEYPCYQIRERRKDESIDPDTIAYQFIVTKENNRLNISKIWDELFGRTTGVCANCGKLYFNKKSGRTLYCDECRTLIRRQQTAARVNAYRARKAAKQTM